MHFCALPDDAILAVVKCVMDATRRSSTTVSKLEHVFFPEFSSRDPEHPLESLSMTCRRLRAVCVPILFQCMSLTDERDLDDIPSVLSHARIFSLRHISTPRGVEALFKAAPRVCEAYCDRGVQEGVLPVILSCPTLEILTFKNVSIAGHFPSLRVAAPLRSLRCIFSSLRSPGDINSKYTPRSHCFLQERELLESVIAQCRATLEVLVLPGESTRLSALAPAAWPRLRELSICGIGPELDASFSQLFAAMPNLEVLTLLLSQRHHGPPLTILPADPKDAFVDLARLVRVTLSYPNPVDGVFRGLTPALRELSIRDSPRFYWITEHSNSFYRTPILCCRDALHIFRQLSDGADAASNLERLELVVRATETEIEDEMELYAFVAAACPRLRVLELHRYRNVLDPRDVRVAIPLDAIADALQGFRSLSHLRLNVDLPLQWHTPDSYPRFVDELDELAARVARALPWLDTFELFHMNFADRYTWQPWRVQPGGGGVLRVLKPHYIESYDMAWL
ncbi:hypothetical protein AURDEDRAFT_188020 [Auricularia subglabra TFB-10046 SS5]|uniref:F-box domain-containing protein n=1 Tax=Auricularia subglabra (strain TFB-10046 / SS5) TaxID=717982 RepID=J0DAY2_AURST|nr:hypothetical protein AURDEDRAFT_188020 [Auricularia subglabra TFB-10046 SS5]